jgi:hypothetical protein
MQDVEPRRLPEIRALAADLEREPLVAEVFFFQASVAQHVGSVVLLNEVVYYCAGFPEREARVGVLDGWSRVNGGRKRVGAWGSMRTWRAAVGVEVDKGLLLDGFEFKRVDFVGEAEFFED